MTSEIDLSEIEAVSAEGVTIFKGDVAGELAVNHGHSQSVSLYLTADKLRALAETCHYLADEVESVKGDGAEAVVEK